MCPQQFNLTLPCKAGKVPALVSHVKDIINLEDEMTDSKQPSMEFINRVNAEYEQIVATTNPGPQLRELEARMAEKGMVMFDKAFPTFLKPYFVDQRNRPMIAKATKDILSGIEKVGKAFIDGYDFEGLVHQSGRIAELSKVDPVYPHFQGMVRLDCFYHPDTGEMKFIEFNCGDPSGMGWNDAMLDIFLSLPALKELSKRFQFYPDYLLETHRATMLRYYGEFCERKGIKAKEKPVFGIICWNQSTILADFELIVERLQRAGYEAYFGDPSELKYDGKDVTLNGIKLDIIYRDAITDFLKDEFWPNCQQIIKAYRDGAICFINPIRAATGDFKTLPAIMTMEKYRKLFTEDEWETYQKHVPWTRLVKSGKTDFHGKVVDLLTLLKNNKDEFVLKPNEGYGGFGIMLGLDATQADWEDKLNKAFAPGADYAVQEFVRIPQDKFPTIVGDELKAFELRNVNINFWSHGGEFAGAFLRASFGNIINVHQGGGLVPVIFLGEK